MWPMLVTIGFLLLAVIALAKLNLAAALACCAAAAIPWVRS